MNKILAQLSSKRLPGIFRAHVVIHGGTCVIKDLHNSGHARICCYYFRFNLFLNHFKVENSNRKRLCFQFALNVCVLPVLSTDIDECKQGNKCPDYDKECNNTDGGYFCNCRSGYGQRSLQRFTVITKTHYLEAAAGKKNNKNIEASSKFS